MNMLQKIRMRHCDIVWCNHISVNVAFDALPLAAIILIEIVLIICALFNIYIARNMYFKYE